MKETPSILLTFDVEEFDLPLEYKIHISDEEAMAVGKRGLDVISGLIQRQSILTTLFTTADFALHYPETIRDLSQSHEIGSHAFYHGKFRKEDLLDSRITLERIISSPVNGLR